MPAGGFETPGHQTWSWNPIEDVANMGSDVVGFITGPPGDPGRLRQAAKEVEDLSARYDADQGAITEAVGELLRTWQGDSANNFHARWHGDAGGRAATAVLADAKNTLDGFAKRLNDYADQLEHAQHDHWIQTALMAALTVANVAQLGLDPATDAAEVGLASVGTMALRQGAIGAFSDVVGQAGGDLWDHLDTGFDHTGDYAVGWFDPVELIITTAGGAIGGTMLAGGARMASTLARRLSAGGDVVALAGGDATLTLETADSWGNQATLARHFADHGADFDAATADEYAADASRFLQRAQAEGLPTKVDADGVIRVYQPASNTFGAYKPDATTRTFYKPSSPTYWHRQPGSVPWSSRS